MLQNEWLSCAVSEDGQRVSLLHPKAGRPHDIPGELFVLRCQTGNGKEITFQAKSQNAPKMLLTNQVMTIFYPTLTAGEQDWNIHLMLTFSLDEDKLRLDIEIENSSDCGISAIQCFSFSEDFRHAPIRKGEYRRLAPRHFSIP